MQEISFFISAQLCPYSSLACGEPVLLLSFEAAVKGGISIKITRRRRHIPRLLFFYWHSFNPPLSSLPPPHCQRGDD